MSIVPALAARLKLILAATAAALLLAIPAARSQAPAPASPAQNDASRKTDSEVIALRREVDALRKQVEILTSILTDVVNQMVISVNVDVVTGYFGGDSSTLEPKVISSYPGKLVSANVILVKTEREGAGTFTIGRSVLITPGGSVPIAVDGADAPCNWIVYDEGNAIKVRSDTCNYLNRGLRGYFTGAAYYKR